MAKPARKAAKRPAARPVAKRPARAAVRAKPAARPKPAPNGAAVDKQRFTLHGFALSGPTYTVALMLSLCKHPFSYIHVNLREGAHKQPDYLVKNRYGQVPCLRDGQIFLCQSAAILEHLSTALGKFDAKTPVGAPARPRMAVLELGQVCHTGVALARPRARLQAVRRRNAHHV